MLNPGAARQRLARALNVAYGDGLLSESTLAHRLDLLLGSRLIDPSSLIGDLSVRSPRCALSRVLARAARSSRRLWRRQSLERSAPPIILALDWLGGQGELLIGRHPECDIVLTHATVSRQHARLRFRDGSWILQDLGSTNGTTVNDAPVVRCQLLPGDHLLIGDEHLCID